MAINFRRLRVGAVAPPAIESLIPHAPFGYANQGSTPVTGGSSIISVTNMADLKDNLQTPGKTVIVMADITNTSTTGQNYGIFNPASDVTLVSAPGVTLRGFGIFWQTDGSPKNNIMVRNCVFRDMPNFAAVGLSDRDYISLKNGQKRVYIEHCDFYSEAGEGVDGFLDTTNGCDFVTIAHCKFANDSKASLVGLRDPNTDPNQLRVTYAYNWFLNNLERQPKYGATTGHCFNNFCEQTITRVGYQGYAMGVSAGAILRIDNNVFKDFTGEPLKTLEEFAIDGTMKYGYFSGINTNSFINCGANDFNGQVESNWLPPYAYDNILLPTSAVEAYVKANAGQTRTLAQMGY